jgi:hypothetical protein
MIFLLVVTVNICIVILTIACSTIIDQEFRSWTPVVTGGVFTYSYGQHMTLTPNHSRPECQRQRVGEARKTATVNIWSGQRQSRAQETKRHHPKILHAR